MGITRPTKSNTSDQSCSPTTSNCVTWQGPALPCIHLCTGDTVSDVVFKLATEMCDIKSILDLTDFDLQALVGFCTTTPLPAMTLIGILGYLRDKIACLHDLIPANPDVAVPVSISPCLGGTTGTTYSYHDAINLIATKLVNVLGTHCSTNNVIDEIYNAIDTINNTTIPAVSANVYQVQTQLNNFLATQTVTLGSCSSLSAPASVAQVVQELEQQMCKIIGVLDNSSPIQSVDKGTTAIVNGIAKGTSCASNTSPSLSQTGQLGNLPGWINTVTGLGDSINNLWIALCDVRAAVKLIQDNCCKVTCDSINVDFNSSFDLTAKTLTLDFGSSIIPIGFVDRGTDITVTDSNGLSVHIVTNGVTYPYIVTNSGTAPSIIQTLATCNAPTSTTGCITIPIGGLATGKLLVSFKSNFQLTADGSTCNNCFSKEINYVNDTCCSITNTGSAAVTLTIQTCTS